MIFGIVIIILGLIGLYFIRKAKVIDTSVKKEEKIEATDLVKPVIEEEPIKIKEIKNKKQQKKTVKKVTPKKISQKVLVKKKK